MKEVLYRLNLIAMVLWAGVCIYVYATADFAGFAEREIVSLSDARAAYRMSALTMLVVGWVACFALTLAMVWVVSGYQKSSGRYTGATPGEPPSL